MKTKNIFISLLFMIFFINASCFSQSTANNVKSTSITMFDFGDTHTQTYAAAALEMSLNPHNEEQVIRHICEAEEAKINPIALAIQRNDLTMAELLLIVRKIEISLGIRSFEFPGYCFKKPFGRYGEEVLCWAKAVPVTLWNKRNEERIILESKIDVEVLKLLMKYDDEKLWKCEVRNIFSHAFHRCDLEGILFCFQLSWDNKEIDVGNAILKPKYLVDPFLSTFPINLEEHSHFYHKSPKSRIIPCIWESRDDDNKIVRKIKKQIQYIRNGSLKDDLKKELVDLKKEFSNVSTQLKAEVKSLGEAAVKGKSEMDILSQKLTDSCKELSDETIKLRRMACAHNSELSMLRAHLAENCSNFKKEFIEMRREINEFKNNQAKSLEIEQVLVKYGNNPEGMTTLHYAITKGDIRAVQLLLDNGADINSLDWMFSPLSRAVKCNQRDITKILLEKGADPNLFVKSYPHTSQKQYTPIYYAALSGSAEVVQLLIEYDADININYGSPERPSTPLHHAAKAGNYAAVVVLVNSGASVDANLPTSKSVNHWSEGTPLDWAVGELKYIDNPQNLELVKYLVEKGATRRWGGNVQCPVIQGYLQSKGR